jgi:hypothetical protein
MRDHNAQRKIQYHGQGGRYDMTEWEHGKRDPRVVVLKGGHIMPRVFRR